MYTLWSRGWGAPACCVNPAEEFPTALGRGIESRRRTGHPAADASQAYDREITKRESKHVIARIPTRTRPNSVGSDSPFDRLRVRIPVLIQNK
jgi:hypothetical protein